MKHGMEARIIQGFTRFLMEVIWGEKGGISWDNGKENGNYYIMGTLNPKTQLYGV